MRHRFPENPSGVSGSKQTRSRNPGSTDLAGRLLAWAFVRMPFVANLWGRNRGQGGPPPFVVPARPLSRMRIGLITTGGVHHVDQVPFHRKNENPQGDGSYRRLDLARPRDAFVLTHDWYDGSDAGKDLNLVLPAERLRELAEEGIIGELCPAAIGMMGHVHGNEATRLERETAPEISAIFRDAAADAVLLVPA